MARSRQTSDFAGQKQELSTSTSRFREHGRACRAAGRITITCVSTLEEHSIKTQQSLPGDIRSITALMLSVRRMVQKKNDDGAYHPEQRTREHGATIRSWVIPLFSQGRGGFDGNHRPISTLWQAVNFQFDNSRLLNRNQVYGVTTFGISSASVQVTSQFMFGSYHLPISTRFLLHCRIKSPVSTSTISQSQSPKVVQWW